MTSIVNKLTPVTSTQKENVRIAPKTERYHKTLLSQIESMDQIEVGEICTSEPKKSKLFRRRHGQLSKKNKPRYHIAIGARLWNVAHSSETYCSRALTFIRHGVCLRS